jgi:hypothetical protein
LAFDFVFQGTSMTKIGLSFAAGALLLASAFPANALTVSTSSTLPAPDGLFFPVGVTTVTWNSVGSAPLTSGSVPGVKRSVWDTSASNSDPRTYAVAGPDSNFPTGFITYDFAKLMTSLSFVWGSPDSYNTLELLNGSTIVGTITPGSTPNLFVNSIDSTLVTVLLNSSEFFNGLRFTSTTAAFEFANITATAVPLPPALLLFGASLFGLGAARKRKIAAAA